jgi:hypothetical protein
VGIDGFICDLTEEEWNACAYKTGSIAAHWLAYDPVTQQLSTTPYTTWT